MIRNNVYPTQRTSREDWRRILRNDVEIKDIIVVQDVHPKRSRMDLVLVPRSKATKREMKRKVGKMIIRKVRNILITKNSPSCLLGASNTCH